MTTKNFFKRRLIRLHPMVLMGVVLGVITYCIQGCVKWDGSHVALSMVILAMLINMFLIPAIPGKGPEVRGNGEMFPLNGPNWSLFFEYIGNILYALLIRRLSTKALTILVVVLGILLASYAISPYSGFGYLGAGWSLSGYNFPGGFLRMTFSYSAGLLISRIFKPIHIRGAFWICSLVIVALVSLPRIGGADTMWMNAIYESICVIIIFPILVYLAASGTTTDTTSTNVCKFLGDISYPLYMVHYPFMYLFFAWVWKNKYTFSQVWFVAIIVVLWSILLAYLCLKLYDEPVRKWLSKKLL